MADLNLKSIDIRNYRCFEELHIEFGKKLTLFVGKNGAGKTSILDAVAVAISTFLCGIQDGKSRNISKEDARYEFYEMAGMTDAQHQFPVVIDAVGECNGKQDISWSRALNSVNGKTTIKDAHNLISIAEDMQKQVMEGNREIILPVLSYYGTGRLYAQKKERRDIQKLQKFNRQVGYIDCMAAESNEKLMLNWFEKMTLKSLQNQQKTGKAEKIPQLAVVEEAVCESFRKISNCRKADLSFDLDTHRIIIIYEDHSGKEYRFAMNELSDGYKNTLSMIADIAYRMVVLNPQLGEETLQNTPGIILIDEVDLHLHPEWQQSILTDLQEIFPRVQFLVTSHAPAVINSVSRENVRILEWGKIYVPAEQTYGRDANSILREVMQVEERPKVVQQKLLEFYDAIDKENIAEAEKTLNEIEKLIGDNDPEVNAAKVKLDLKKMWEE